MGERARGEGRLTVVIPLPVDVEEGRTVEEEDDLNVVLGGGVEVATLVLEEVVLGLELEVEAGFVEEGLVVDVLLEGVGTVGGRLDSLPPHAPNGA